MDAPRPAANRRAHSWAATAAAAIALASALYAASHAAVALRLSSSAARRFSVAVLTNAAASFLRSVAEAISVGEGAGAIGRSCMGAAPSAAPVVAPASDESTSIRARFGSLAICKAAQRLAHAAARMRRREGAKED